MIRFRTIGVLAWASCACQTAQPATPQCITDNPRTGALTARAQSEQANCTQDGGSGCDATTFISQDAALCLAADANLAAGIKPWTAQLTYHHGVKLVRWNVQNTTYDHGPYDGIGGDYLAFNAVSGALIDSGKWSAIP